MTRESAMRDYQFTKKMHRGDVTKGGYKLRSGQLTTIPDTEQYENISQFNSRYMKEKNILELTDINLFENAIPTPRKRTVFISIVQLNASIDNIVCK